MSGALKDVKGEQKIVLENAKITSKGVDVKGNPGNVSLQVSKSGNITGSTSKTVKVEKFYVTVQTLKAGSQYDVLAK